MELLWRKNQNYCMNSYKMKRRTLILSRLQKLIRLIFREELQVENHLRKDQIVSARQAHIQITTTRI